MRTTFWRRLKTVFRPLNLLKTAAATGPFTGGVSEMINQLEAEGVREEIDLLKIQISVKGSPPSPGFEHAAFDFRRRTVQLTVFKDDEFWPTGLGCYIGKNRVLTSDSALVMTQQVAEMKGGTPFIWAEVGRAEFTIAEAPKNSAARVLRTSDLDITEWKAHAIEAGLPKSLFDVSYLDEPVIGRPLLYIGEELGIIHHGEAEEEMFGFPRLQFDRASIAFLVKRHPQTLTTFAMTPLPSRIVFSGAPAFRHDGTIAGVVLDSMRLQNDMARRPVVEGLLGLSDFPFSG